MNRAFFPADILLPNRNIQAETWAVIACDQFTSEPQYWEETERLVKENPSTLRMILPEVYLEADDVEKRLDAIKETMKNYWEQNIFKEYPQSMIYLERTDSIGNIRRGVIGCFDLETYDYKNGSQSLIRATEATVVERIPPRIKVRKNALVELPHIMILIDDEEQSVVEPLAEKKESLTKLYDFDLMQGGGHSCGYLLGKEEQKQVLNALDRLGSREVFEKKYGITGTAVLQYAMGDGNHSLATAKEYYEQLKAENPGKDFSNHPARYALAELVNLHSPALEFEAIHRIMLEVDPEHLKSSMKEKLGLMEDGSDLMQSFWIMEHGISKKYFITKPTSKLTVGSVQKFLDSYLMQYGGRIDYIHGLEVMKNLTEKENSLGILLPDMGKEELFQAVIVDGALPRKTFSMGHAQDKRYYMECRRITDSY